MRYIISLFLLLSAACGPGSWYQRTNLKIWKEHGACVVACDYHQGYMSIGTKLNENQCRCYTPQLRDFNDGRQIPLDNPDATYTFAHGVSYEALRICAHQPWRCPEDLPLP